jgi:hypothetical protein
MIGLLQRVSHASVVVDGATVGAIGHGLMVLVCAEKGDTEREADALIAKLLGYRVFSDEAGKMNRSVVDTAGALLLCPSSRWQPIPARVPGRRSRRPRAPPMGVACSTISCARPGRAMAKLRPVNLAPT